MFMYFVYFHLLCLSFSISILTKFNFPNMKGCFFSKNSHVLSCLTHLFTISRHTFSTLTHTPTPYTPIPSIKDPFDSSFSFTIHKNEFKETFSHFLSILNPFIFTLHSSLPNP